MKVLVMTMTHNRADILPFFLRHYETFSDRIIVFDDGSTDGTRDIAEDHPLTELRDYGRREGIREDLFLEHWYKEYPKAAGSFQWVVIVDSDEFLLPMKRGETIRKVMYRSMDYDVIRANGFNLIGPEFPKDDGRQIYEINPLGVFAPLFSKPICFKPEARVRWIRGRHRLEDCTPEVCSPGPTPDARLKILHARYFGAKYTKARNALNYERVFKDKGLAWTCTDQWKGEGSPEWVEDCMDKRFDVVAQEDYPTSF